MIRARHKAIYVWFFDLYSRWMIRHHFSKVKLSLDLQPSASPVLLIGNHFSWWDGFIACYINQRIFKRKFHVMMLEEQLRSRIFLNKAGAYSIRKNSRSMLESIQYTSSLLEDVKNLVVLYPQGEFSSIYQREIHFEKGVCAVVRHVNNKFSLIFYVALIDYFSDRKPSLSIYLKEVTGDMASDPYALETAYNVFYAGCVNHQKPD